MQRTRHYAASVTRTRLGDGNQPVMKSPRTHNAAVWPRFRCLGFERLDTANGVFRMSGERTPDCHGLLCMWVPASRSGAAVA